MPLPTLAWDFNGTTTDYVSRVIPVSSAGFSYSTGKYQQGASFTNTVGSTPTNYIVYDFTAISSAAFTVCCWVNTVASAGGGIAVSIAGGNREGDIRIFLGGTSPGNILTQYRMLTTPPSTYTYVNASSATNSVVAGVWNHIAVTITESSVNGSVLSCFFNGSLASTTTSAYGAPRNLNGMGVGAFYSLLFNNGYNGLIDDLRIYNTALTAAQVSSIWAQQGVPGRGALVPQSPQPSLVWQFESSNVDSVTGLAPTTSVGPPTYNSAGKYGSSIVFNNTPGVAPGTYYLTYTTGISLSTASGFTVCAWLKPLAVGVSGNQTFLSIAGQNTFFIFQIDGSATNIHLYGQNPFTVPNSINGSAFSVTQSTWFHAVMVFSGTSITTYYNGTLKDSLSLVVSPVTFSSIGLGNRSAINADSAANGELDDLRVYNTALTAAQVQAIYGTSGMPSRQVLTGTPLFTQLSTSATSSAVGAFSLRAVNGTSARAVQVRPVAAVPAAAMSSNGPQTLTGYSFGGGGSYTASVSSFGGSSFGWKVFDKDINTYWNTNYTYTGAGANSSNTYIVNTYSTTVSGSTVYGEWIQIQMPTAIYPYTYTLTPPYDAAVVQRGFPYQWTLAGSNDGAIWTTVDTQNGINTWTNLTPKTFTSASSSTAYSYYRLIVQAVNSYSTLTSQLLNISEWTVNGSNASWNTDFYADRLGNLLTAPVTGQSLAKWLGGATGYVTTWYDQSGAGQHMAQTTASLQPIISLATSPPSILFTGNGTTSGQYFQNTIPFTFNFGTNYQYSIRAVVNNTVGGVLVYKGKQGAPWNGNGEKAWYLGPSSLTSTSGNYPDLVGFAEGWVITSTPITSSKTSVTWASSSFSSVAVYENASSVTPSYTRASQLSDASNYLYFGITTASGVPYYNGNIYEIEIFSTPLSVSDVTIMG
jgi:hypothetical protein